MIVVVSAVITGTTWVWLALEIGLMVRDRRRGKGGTAKDRGTRRLNFLVTFVAIALADVLSFMLRPDVALLLPGWRHPALWHPLVDLAVMWLGLAVRVWAILVLGRSFRTTVEVDAGQAVVDTGPYRRVRHPSYSGIMLICLGIGLTRGNWISLAVMLLLPLAVLLRRMDVEEAVLAEVLGEPYRAYQARTKRLVPYLW